MKPDRIGVYFEIASIIGIVAMPRGCQRPLKQARHGPHPITAWTIIVESP